MSLSTPTQAAREPKGPHRMREQTVTARLNLYRRACALIEHGYRRPLTLPAVAAILAISPRNLQRVFEQYGSRTFSDELRWRRMNAACELLAHLSLPIDEVAQRVGVLAGAAFRAGVPALPRPLAVALPTGAARSALSAPWQGARGKVRGRPAPARGR